MDKQQFYITNLGTLYHSDCLDFMESIPNNYIDMILTSPPYDNLRNYGNSLIWNFKIFKKIAKELNRILKAGGVIVWIVGDATINGSETLTSFKQAIYFNSLGLNLHDTMIYQKQNPIYLTHNRYEQEFEYMFIFSKGNPKTFNPIKEKTKSFGQERSWQNNNRNYENGSKRFRQEKTKTKEYKIKKNIWSYVIGQSYDGIHKHPAIFPEKLAIDHIKSWSNKNDLVFDPFMGSGTTAKACEELDRKWIGSEKNYEYCQIIKNRIESYNKQLKLFSFGDL